MESQYDAHIKTHVSCQAPDCEFSASKRVVGAHFQTAHGQYAGQGLKEIDVEGQKFMVLVGNSPEDIAKWRSDRRKRWPSGKKAEDLPVTTLAAPRESSLSKKRKLPSTVDGGDDEDLEDGEIDEDESAVGSPPTAGEEEQTGSSVPMDVQDHAAASDAATIAKPSPSPFEEPSPKKQKRVMLCRKFLHNQCRFGDNCKFSHDRKAFPCRSMLQKGKCTKGDTCFFSHDAQQLQDAATKQKQKPSTTKSERVLEEKWKTEQGSLLRKLLKSDIHVEQQRMLQIVRFLVSNKFFEGDEQDDKARNPAAPATTTTGAIEGTAAAN